MITYVIKYSFILEKLDKTPKDTKKTSSDK